ncbi:IclR family transcriptional regulator [Gordonia soli]|uniref:Putative IclR family transcriptional regulator n=1 Tax=Gordonia soli NBRC 108243 TaxID=1223545 RepID=M0QRT5_9ACTN|nr:IclR family transcriptional regulator [Gordonia soli]GAC70362.1 putative IclR family transcriptional regulator [Gordonia soli NBRC 108243]
MTTLLTDDSAVSVANALPLSMVERMTLIMEAFDRPLARLTLDEVTQHTGLPRSTAHRILDQLVQCRWLIHAKTHYSLGSRALTLGGRELAQHELRSAASPVLQSLAMRTGALVHLAILAGPEIYYLDMFGGRTGQRIASQVGGRAPAHRTAAGKAILAGLTPEYVDNQYSGPSRGARAHVGDIDGLHHELARIRARNGLAIERGECFRGLACVGAAIRSGEGPVGAISIVTRQDSALEPLAPMVVRAARTISDSLARVHAAY